jgi:hypothetical protein
MLSAAAAMAVIACSEQPQGSGGAEQSAGPIKVQAPLVNLAVLEEQRVEVGCGQCIYDLPDADGCVPAAVVNGSPMLLDGLEIDVHDHGLCTASGHAIVSGTVKDGTLVATAFDIEPGE